MPRFVARCLPELPVFHAVRYLPYPLFLFHKDFGEALVIAIHHRRLSMDHRKTIHTKHQEQLQLPFQASTTSTMSLQEREMAMLALAHLFLEAAGVTTEEICDEQQ